MGEPFTETAILFWRDRTIGRATADSCVWFIISEPPQEKKGLTGNNKVSIVGKCPVG